MGFLPGKTHPFPPPVSSDGRRSLFALVDASGAIVERYRYDAFGNTKVCDGSGTPRAENKSACGNPYMFTARRFDAESGLGLYYYRARIYSPALGRFLQPDPIGYADSMNLYQYCGNNPTNFIDPWGAMLYPVPFTEGGRKLTPEEESALRPQRPYNERAAEWAEGMASSPFRWKYDQEYPFPRGYKCNRFVRDAYTEGAGAPFPRRLNDRGWPDPPSASQLANPNFEMTGYPVVMKGKEGKPLRDEDLLPGDILAGDGHSMIYIGNGFVAQGSSSGKGVSITPLSENQRMNCTVRRCNMSPPHAQVP